MEFHKQEKMFLSMDEDTLWGNNGWNSRRQKEKRQSLPQEHHRSFIVKARLSRTVYRSPVQWGDRQRLLWLQRGGIQHYKYTYVDPYECDEVYLGANKLATS